VRRYGDKWKRAITASAAARELRSRGFRPDVAAATEVDIHRVVPEYSGKLVT
jgi:phosphosulfolactate phosphohydrolase-like enzyme